jgi:clorobiocin biosynthesis protein CloN4
MSDYPIVRRLLVMPADWASRTAFSAAAGRLAFAALRADMLAFAGWLVREAGVRPGDRVAICLPRSLEMVRATYGVLAAGAAYVGLQFRGPPARLGAILASIEPRLLLTTAEMSAQLAADGGPARLPPTLAVEEEEGGRGLDSLLRGARPLDRVVPVRPEDLAAVIFTSGSTGEPKGVMRSQRNLAQHVLAQVRDDGVGPDDMRPANSALHYSPPTLFYPAASGCRVHLLTDEDVMFPEIVSEILEREHATSWRATATALRLAVERGDLGRRRLESLRLVSSYGEPLSVDLLRKLVAAFPRARVVSTYGSTEAPSVARFEAPRPLPEALQSVPLGRVADHYALQLCDEAGSEVAPGEVGEICVSGPSVSPGYWRDPELSRSRQVRGRPGSYRTGDLAFAARDGMLHFAGRRDRQIKLRGHRFDLGEIEAALKSYPAVREAVALAVPGDGGETAIHAVVEAPSQAGLLLALRGICAERLPRYAWPERVSVRDELPRLANGKIDCQTLRKDIQGGRSES